VGPGVRRVTATGASKQVNLDERNVIRQNDTLVFRATFTDIVSGESVLLSGTPYFRGMPLPRLVIENGMTTWKAPHDSVFDISYRPLPDLDSLVGIGNQARKLNQKIVLEGTVDPLLYASMPIFRPRPIDDRSEFCIDLSALTRRRKGELTEMSSYKYETLTIVGPGYQPLMGWPYQSKANEATFPSLDDAPGEKAGLLYHDPKRYPKLVETANQIARNTGSQNTIELCNAMTSHFSKSNRFRYTVDFRDVPRVSKVDPIEDFFANHRSGHCELFASALTLMLRSQGIPARIILGFYGGEYNQLTSCYMVRGRQAHAWVEAYIPPKDCSEQMRQQGVASAGGCWLTLDPTPAVNNLGGNEALDLARTIWQDYVLSVDENQQEEIINVSKSGILNFLELGRLRPLVNQTIVQVRERSELQGLLLAIVVMIVVISILFQRRDWTFGRNQASSRAKIGRLRRFVGDALSLISPKLGALILSNETYTVRNVPFYLRMTRAMARVGLEREPHQTQREFAALAIQQLSLPLSTDERMDRSFVAQAIMEITERFYQVRFGNQALDSQGLRDIERTVDRLEQELKSVKLVNLRKS
jgi:hypothetical protein